MQPNQPSQPPLTFQQKLNVALFLCELAAITVLPLLRHRIGLRTLAPPRLLPVLFILFVVGNPIADDAFAPRHIRHPLTPAKPGFSIFTNTVPAKTSAESETLALYEPSGKWFGRGWLGIFAILSLILAARQAGLRQRELRQGVAWHSCHRGISVFSFLRPNQAGACERIADPLVCMALGLIVWQTLSAPLGLWLIFSGMALRCVEYTLHKRNVERNLDAIDGTIDGQTLSQVVQHFEQHPTTTRRMHGDVEILHTALSPDVEALIARRKKRKPPAP